MDCTPIILAHEPPFRIGQVEIRPATRELERGGRISILEPRVMQVLVALHQARGSVLTKDDLVSCCWDGRIVGDDAINRVIGRLRHEASDHAGHAFRIETITRVGYRLVEDGEPRGVDRRRLVIGGVVAATALTGGTLAWRRFDHSPLNPEARSLLDEATSALRQGTADQVTNAVSKLAIATSLAPDSGEAWGLLARAYRSQAQQVPADQRPLVEARATSAARRALAIDPDNGDALAAEVWAIPTDNRVAFESAARNALRRNPDHAMVNLSLAYILSQVGRTRESLMFDDRAVKRDPLNVFSRVFQIGALWDVGRLAEAERAMEAGYRLWPRHYALWFTRFYFLTYNGRAGEALSMISDEGGRPVGIPEWNLALTQLQAEAVASQNPARIDEVVAKWSDAARAGSGFAENAIVFAGRMGRLDAAFETAEGYYFNHGFRLGEHRWSREQAIYTPRGHRQSYFLFGRGLEAFRRDARFADLTRAIGLDDYWRKTNSSPDYLG